MLTGLEFAFGLILSCFVRQTMIVQAHSTIQELRDGAHLCVLIAH